MQKKIAKYKRLVSALCDQILSGQFPPGARLPGHRILAEQYKVSTITANRALSELEKMGLAVRRPRSGTFVAEHAGSLRQVVVILPDTESQDAVKTADYWAGIRGRAEQLGVEVESQSAGQFADELRRYPERFIGKGALLIMTPDKPLYPLIRRSKLPAVMVGREDALIDFCACEDRRRACRDLVQTLHRRGARHIAFLKTPSAPNHRQAEEGYIEGVELLGLPKKYICEIRSNDPCWQAGEFLRNHPQVDSVIPMGAFLPIATMPAILKADRNIQIAVMTESASILQLRETAIVAHYSQRQTGQIAMTLLHEMVRRGNLETVTRYASYEILLPRE